jgi:hypothetical protein
MSTKKKNSPAPTVPPVTTDANAPEVTAPTAPAAEAEKPKAEKPKAEKPKAATKSLVVAEEVLKGIFNDDPKGKYFSKDGETFLNEEQLEKLEDKSGYEKFEK